MVVGHCTTRCPKECFISLHNHWVQLAFYNHADIWVSEYISAMFQVCCLQRIDKPPQASVCLLVQSFFVYGNVSVRAFRKITHEVFNPCIQVIRNNITLASSRQLTIPLTVLLVSHSPLSFSEKLQRAILLIFSVQHLDIFSHRFIHLIGE